MAEVIEQQQKLARPTNFAAMLDRYKSEIGRALPRHMSADRMARIALTEFRKNPKLADCDPRSVFAAIIIASQLGLEPGVLGQAYLIPYKNECQLIPGYQGLVDLVRRSGIVQRIEAHVVRQGEKFTYRTGLKTVLEHEPMLEGTPGPLRLAYAVAEFKEGGYHVEVMVEDQINRIRDRSQGYINAKKYGKDTPWETDTEEMWRKTLLRRICKFLPKSPEMVTALSLEEAAAQGRQAISVQDAIEGTWQAPVLEVTTQDNNLAAKSRENLEEIKAKYAQQQLQSEQSGPKPDPQRIEQLRAEAARQQRMVDEKYGASQLASQPVAAVDTPPLAGGNPAAATETPVSGTAAPTNQQPPEVPQGTAVVAEGGTGVASSAPDSDDDPEWADDQREEADAAYLTQHGIPNIFDDPPPTQPKPKRKR